MTKKRVLLVDEDDATREIIREMLEHRGYEIGEAATGEEGLAALRDDAYDLVILAFPVPMPEGGTLTESIRKTDGVGKTPILAVTAEVRPWEVDRALKSGCDAYCTKPIDPRLIAIQVRDMIGPPLPD